MHVLVTGVSGFLGGYLAQQLQQEKIEVIGTYHSHRRGPEDVPLHHLDLADPAPVVALWDAVKPDCVIHCAALAKTGYCEQHPDEARQINVEGTRHVARACQEQNVPLIYTSTDLVFDGSKQFWKETDPPAPLNVYAKTKKEGEEVVEQEMDRVSIVRCALMCGNAWPGSQSFTDWMADRLGQGGEVPLYVDEYRTPLYVRDAAEALTLLVQRLPQGVEIFHLGGPERVNRWEFGLLWTRLLNASEAQLRQVSYKEQSTTLPRAADCSLDSTKLQTWLGWKPRPLSVAFGEMAEERRANQ